MRYRDATRALGCLTAAALIAAGCGSKADGRSAGQVVAATGHDAQIVAFEARGVAQSYDAPRDPFQAELLAKEAHNALGQLIDARAGLQGEAPSSGRYGSDGKAMLLSAELIGRAMAALEDCVRAEASCRAAETQYRDAAREWNDAVHHIWTEAGQPPPVIPDAL